MIQSKVIKDFKDNSTIKSKWDYLVNKNRLDVSVSYDWSLSIFNSHLKKKEIDIFSIEDGDVLLCVMPIILRKKTIKKIPVNLLCCLSDLSNVHNDLIIDKDKIQTLDVFFSQLNSDRVLKKWDVMEFSSMIDGGDSDLILKNYLKNNNFKFKISKGPLSPYINIEKYSYSWDDYFNSLKKKAKGNFKRKKNKINREGSVEINRVFDHDMIENIITKVESKSWKNENSTSIVNKGHQLLFYKSLWQRFNDNFIFFTLFFDGNPISYSMGIIHRDKYYSLKTSYINDFRELSPGIVLRLELLQHCFESHLREFDFCGEFEEWKKDFTNEARAHNHYLIYNKKIFSKFLSYIS